MPSLFHIFSTLSFFVVEFPSALSSFVSQETEHSVVPTHCCSNSVLVELDEPAGET